MTPDQLERRCVALFGVEWQTILANAVRVDARTVRRWKAGDRAIPEWLDVLLGYMER